MTTQGGGLLISDRASLQLKYAAEAMPKNEISGFGRTVDRGDGVIELVDIVIPPQEVGGAHVDISPEVRDAFWALVVKNGCTLEYAPDGERELVKDCERTHEPQLEGVVHEDAANMECDVLMCGGHTRRTREAKHDARCGTGDIKDWRVWWHKHPGTTKPSPSSTDKDTLRDFAGAEGFGFGWMIGVIISEDGSNIYGWLDVATGPWNLTQPDIDIEFAMREVASIRKSIKDQVDKVTVKTYSSSGGSWNRNYPPANGPRGGTNSGGAGTQSERRPSLPPPSGRVKSIAKSDDPDFPNSWEIVMESGAVIVTTDTRTVQALMSQKRQEDEQKQTMRPPRGMKKLMQRSLQAAQRELNREYPTKPRHRKAGETKPFVKPEDKPSIDDLYIGFDWQGEILKKGDERFLYYDLKMHVVPPEVRRSDRDGAEEAWAILDDAHGAIQDATLDDEGKLVPDEIALAIIEAGRLNGQQCIGYDVDGTPCFKGEEVHLFYAIDGMPLFKFDEEPRVGASGIIKDGALQPDLEEARELTDQMIRAGVFGSTPGEVADFAGRVRNAFHLPPDMEDEEAIAWYQAMGLEQVVV